MPYKARSLAAAQRRVRMLEKRMDERLELIEQYAHERKLLALLAADGPGFSNPIHAANAIAIRDQILASMRMNPDGSYKT
jgi:hypothetical protein